ncbi:MAG: HAD family hydrolase [Propionibacteriales bacterium]|nr:HAD family hydrolase [Propionibacteriales bacterium]
MRDDDRDTASDGAGLGRLPQLVASDLDGTLLRGDGTVSQRTVRVVGRLQEAGVEFVLATARPPEWVHDLTSVVGDHGMVICSNGAYVYDVARRRVVSERLFQQAIVIELLTELRQAIPSITFAVQRSDGFGREPRYVGRLDLGEQARVADIEDLLDPLPGKLLARASGLSETDFLERVAEVIGERAIVAHSGTAGLAEISAAGVTKAAVLAQWCATRGIDAADVWAFGDMPNDIDMLTWAGTSFAMANAHRDVLAIASYACASNDDDGVAEVLERALDGTLPHRLGDADGRHSAAPPG